MPVITVIDRKMRAKITAFVLTSSQAVTLPGISVIDAEKEMRPHPLPGPGDLVSAAGPVYRGSYGQRQIQATELHVARSRPSR